MKTVRNIALSAAVAVLLAGCGASPESSFASAGKAFAAHRYGEARIELTNVLQAQPDNAAALDMAVRVNLARQDGIAAIAMLDRLEKLGKLPRDAAELYAEAELAEDRHDLAIARINGVTTPEAWRLRALALIGKGDVGGAQGAFASGMAAGMSGRLLGDYAHFALAQGDLKLARALVAQAMAAKPVELAALLSAGEVALAEGKAALALDRYGAAAKAFPESRAALLGKVAALGTLGRSDDVAALVDSALATSPKDPELLYLKARVAGRAGKWAEARDLMQANETLFEKNWPAQATYGEALLELGQVEQARIKLTAVLAQLPSNRHVRLLVGKAQVATGDAAAAVDTLLPLGEQADATREELALLAKAAKLSGFDGADQLAARAQFPTPEGLAAELARGDTALRAGNWLAAATAYERILTMTDGKNVMVLNNLAVALSEAGDKRKALGYAEQALRLAPDNASVMDTAGWLLHQTGTDRVRAVALLGKAAQLAPGNTTIAAHLKVARAA